MPKGINIFRAVDNVQLFEMTYTRVKRKELTSFTIICTFMYSRCIPCYPVSFHAPSIFFASCVMIWSPYCSMNFWVKASIACGEDSSCFIITSGLGTESPSP